MRTFFKYLAIFLLSELTSSGQTPDGIYGLVAGTGGYYLASVDPVSGIVSQISTSPVASSFIIVGLFRICFG